MHLKNYITFNAKMGAMIDAVQIDLQRFLTNLTYQSSLIILFVVILNIFLYRKYNKMKNLNVVICVLMMHITGISASTNYHADFGPKNIAVRIRTIHNNYENNSIQEDLNLPENAPAASSANSYNQPIEYRFVRVFADGRIENCNSLYQLHEPQIKKSQQDHN